MSSLSIKIGEETFVTVTHIADNWYEVFVPSQATVQYGLGLSRVSKFLVILLEKHLEDLEKLEKQTRQIKSKTDGLLGTILERIHNTKLAIIESQKLRRKKKI